MISIKSGLRQALALGALASLVLLSTANASTTVTTDPVGVVSYTVPQGISVMSNPFLRAINFQGEVASVSGTTVTFSTSGIPDISGSPHFLHVLTGTYAGENITIISATANAVVLELETPGDISGATAAIRPHTTIGSMFEGTEAIDEQVLTLYESNGSIRNYTYYDGFGWLDSGFNSAENVIVYPGEGFAFNTDQSFTFNFSGTVSTHPVAVFISSSASTFMGTLNPAQSVTMEGLGLVSSLPDESTVVFYQTIGGTQSTKIILTNFVDFGGFYDSSFNLRNDYPLGVVGSVVMRTSVPAMAVLPPAYNPN